jgi:hypothetical protein
LGFSLGFNLGLPKEICKYVSFTKETCAVSTLP